MQKLLQPMRKLLSNKLFVGLVAVLGLGVVGFLYMQRGFAEADKIREQTPFVPVEELGAAKTPEFAVEKGIDPESVRQGKLANTTLTLQSPPEGKKGAYYEVLSVVLANEPFTPYERDQMIVQLRDKAKTTGIADMGIPHEGITEANLFNSLYDNHINKCGKLEDTNPENKKVDLARILNIIGVGCD